MHQLKSDYWHDEHLEEVHGTIIECLSTRGESIVNITLTPMGLRIVEGCDGHYGTTLTKDQLARLIDELSALHGRMNGPPEF